MIEIRPACQTDLDWIVGQLKKFAKFYGTKHSLFGDETYTRETFAGIIERHFVKVADQIDAQAQRRRVGFIAALVIPHPLNPAVRTVSEQFWWVTQEYRRSRAGLLLLNELIAFGLANADIVSLSIIEGRSPINEDALTKRGFKLHERAFIMET